MGNEITLDEWEQYEELQAKLDAISGKWETPVQDAILAEHTPRASEKQVGGSHYKDMAIQPTTFIEANKLGWCEGNAVKYICRHKQKGSIKDIEKAIHYLDLLLEKEYCYVRPENTRT